MKWVILLVLLGLIAVSVAADPSEDAASLHPATAVRTHQLSLLNPQNSCHEIPSAFPGFTEWEQTNPNQHVINRFLIPTACEITSNCHWSCAFPTP